MGGRGAFISGSNQFTENGQAYHSTYNIKSSGLSIKVIEPINTNESIRTPTLSHSPNAIYATVRKDGVAKQISVYNSSREKVYDIDLDHDHSGGDYAEGHVQYYIDGKRSDTYYHPNEEQLKLIEALKKGVRK